MLKTRVFRRARRLAIVSFSAFAVLACGGQTITSSGSSSDTTALPEALPNRFADMSYPDAKGHQWSGPEEIYQKVCGYCHAPKPLGGVGPVLLGRQLPAPYIVLTVRNGRNGMPGFSQTEFTDAELEALANMIQSSKAPPQPKVKTP